MFLLKRFLRYGVWCCWFVDEGVEYSFRVTEDKFALGNPTLVNHKTYHYMSIAYGFNPRDKCKSV